MSKISTMERARVQRVDMRSLSKLAMKLQSEDTQQHITVALKVSKIKTDKDLCSLVFHVLVSFNFMGSLLIKSICPDS